MAVNARAASTSTMPSVTRAGSAGPPGPAAVRIVVFGGPRLWRDGVEVDVGPPRRQAVLALLLAARGQVVGVPTLVDALWGEDPASTAMNQLQRHIGEIRRLFEPQLPARGAGTWLSATPNAYRLDVGKADCDLTAFGDLLARVTASEGAAAASLLAEAMQVAAAPPFSGLDPELLASAPIAALRRDRIEVAVRYAASIGEQHPPSGSALAVLEEIAAGEPLNEPLQAAWITALVAAGRRAEAVTHVDRVRRLLADELGIDPGPALRSAFAHTLIEDVPEPAPSAPGASVATVRPAQLPPRVPGFTRRHAVGGFVREQLVGDDGAVAVAVISGMAGIGKTALAVELAHDLAPRFPDGQLYLNLRGFDPSGPPMEPGTAVNFLLESLGVNLSQVPPSLESRLGLYRSMVAERRVLMVLDNAHDSEQVLPLLPGSEGSHVIVTSRHQLTALVVQHNAHPERLGRLTDDEARELLAARLAPERLTAEPAEVDQLVRSCAGLPLALAIVAARAALDRTATMRSIADELSTSTSNLFDALGSDGSRVDVRAVFSWSYNELSPDAAELFRLAAAHPGPDLPLAALAAIAGRPTPEVRRLVGELASANMLTRLSNERYVLHDLLRAYADELLGRHPDPRLAAERRLVAHYQLTARNAFVSYGPVPLDDIDTDGQPVDGLQVDSIDAAIGWYLGDRAGVAAVARLAVTRGWWRAGSMIVLDVRPMSVYHDLPATFVPLLQLAIDASRQSADWRTEAECHRMLGTLQWGDPLHRDDHMREAEALFDQHGDLASQVNVLRNRAMLAQSSGDLRRATEFFDASVDAAERAGRPDLMAVVVGDVAESLIFQERFEEAVSLLEQNQTRIKESGAVQCLAGDSANLAVALANLHQWDRAQQVALQGLDFPQLHVPGHIALCACLCRAAWENDEHERSRAAAVEYLALRADWPDDRLLEMDGPLALENQSHSVVGVQAMARFIAEHGLATPPGG